MHRLDSSGYFTLLVNSKYWIIKLIYYYWIMVQMPLLSETIEQWIGYETRRLVEIWIIIEMYHFPFTFSHIIQLPFFASPIYSNEWNQNLCRSSECLVKFHLHHNVLVHYLEKPKLFQFILYSTSAKFNFS